MAKAYQGLFLFILLLTIAACGVKKTDINPSLNSNPDDDTPRILFLSYNIQKSESGAVKVELREKILTKGVLKDKGQGQRVGKEGDLKCIALGAQEEALSYLILPNPLRESHEYEDENGNLARKEIEHEKADFFIRMQVTPEMESIAIQRVGSSEEAYLINTKIED